MAMGLRKRAAVAALLSILAATSGGCAARTVTEKVFDEGRVTMTLRGETKGGSPVDRGYNHPATVAPVRLAHILARIDLRTDGKSGEERRPAISTGSLHRIADGLSHALSQADTSQEVAALAIRKEKRFGLFDRDYLTSFVAYVKGEQLYIHVSRVDWQIPKDVPKKRAGRLPEPRRGEYPMSFRVIPSRGMAMIDRQSVAIDWRGEVFAQPSRTRTTPDGKVVRRTILMEAEPEKGIVEEETSPLPSGLSATALRRLADLEEQRALGQVSRTEYRSRRHEILSGR